MTAALTDGYHLAFAVGAGLCAAAILIAAIVLPSQVEDTDQQEPYQAA